VTAPHDRPDAREILRSVSAFLSSDVVPATDGVVAYHARIAARLLLMVERELAHGTADAVRHRASLDRLGVDNDAALADAVRVGQFDDRLDELRVELTKHVRARLRVADPRLLEADKPADGP
jgi:hypothetical protein